MVQAARHHFVHILYIIFPPLHFLSLEHFASYPFSYPFSYLLLLENMCGESNRPTVGGTIAVLFPPDNHSSSAASERSRSSSPDSVASSTSSVSSLSSYSLFFRDAEIVDSKNTRAIFQFNDTETYQALREYRQVNMRVE